jgi:hypothetical protein
VSVPFPAKLSAIRAVFSAMFDAVETMGEFDESKWIDLIAAFNATGRLVFGWPHLESSESDIFGALDDIADQLEGTKNAIVQTTTEARVVMHKLHEALDPLLPAEGDDDYVAPGELGNTAHIVSAESQIDPAPVPEPIIEPEYSAPDLTQPEPVVAAPPATDKRHQNGRTRLSPADRQAIRAGRAAGQSIAELAAQFGCDVSRISQLTKDIEVERHRRDEKPRYDVEAMFEVIRRNDSLTDAAMEMGIRSATLAGRLNVLQDRGELPDDILTKRPQKAALAAAPSEDESFEDRRKRLAREQADRTWRQTHPEAQA